MESVMKKLHWVVIGLLLLMAYCESSSARQTSATYDESAYISRGYTYLKTGDTRLKIRHPILLDVVASMPLLLVPDLHLPLDDPGWISADFHRYAQAFLWEANAGRAEQIVFLARLPIMMFSLLLAAGVFRWAKERLGLAAGVVAVTLCVFDPNVLAHGRLVTPDVGQTALIFLAVLAWWRYMQRPGWVRWALAGLCLGLAQAAAFPALVLLPVLAVVSLLHGWSLGRWRGAAHCLATLAGASVLSALTVWAVYSFRWGPVEPWGLSLPAPYYWEEFIDLLQRLDRRDLAFCCGRVYRGGWWAFFVVALFTKTPLPTLGLFGLGLLTVARRRTWLKDAALWLFPAVYYANALNSSLNIGYRHILPIVPFLFVIAAQATALARTKRSTIRTWCTVGLGAGLGWLVVASTLTYPFYLAYFNELVGGPAGGRRWLVVSDLDWGQDLPGLSAYLEEHAVDEVYMSWFGTTPPEHYDIHYQPLPAWPPRGDPLRFAFHPTYPLPGVYAISAANLEGARLADPATFSWFQARPPEAQVGHSILIYTVPRLLDPSAPPAHVLLSGLSLADLPASVIETQLHTNDIHPRWFDARQALIVPSERALLAVSEETPLEPHLAERFLPAASRLDRLHAQPGAGYDLYDLQSTMALEAYLRTQIQTQVYTSPILVPSLTETSRLSTPLYFGQLASFLGYELLTERIEPGGEVALLSVWQVTRRVEEPLAMFVHLLSTGPSILGQHDGLDVPSRSWYPGDVIVQLHRFNVPATLPDGPLWLELGLYRTDTLARLPALSSGAEAVGDRILLANISPWHP
jgi:hypothetical protein